MALKKDDSFSDYFTPDDEILDLLKSGSLLSDVEMTAAEPSVEPPQTVVGQKRHRSPETEKAKSASTKADVKESSKDTHKDTESNESESKYTDSEIYSASTFGGYGDYMRHKRAKLQIQNSEIGPQKKSNIMQGVSIYVNGRTNPSIQDLRKLIIEHGGVFQPYLDKKSLVTHVITTGITAAKRKDWQNLKVVTPEWITESIKQGQKLDWRDFKLRLIDSIDGAQGVAIKGPSLLNTRKGAILAALSDPSKRASTSVVPDRSARGSSTVGQVQAPANEKVQPLKASSKPSTSSACPTESITPSDPKQGPREQSRPTSSVFPMQRNNLAKAENAPQSTTSNSSLTLKHQQGEQETSSLQVHETIQAAVPVAPKKRDVETAFPPKVDGSTIKPGQQSLLSPKKLQPSSTSRSLYVTDPATEGEGERIEGYAIHDSNPAASKAMKSAEWRKAHTSVSDHFIEGYYKNSRLHYLSTWKAELKTIVAAAMENADRDSEITGQPRVVKPNETVVRSWSMLKGKGKEQDKVIMHCDFDSFFVAAGLVDRPHLVGKPVVVCHSQGTQGGVSSTSEVASASYTARGFGIRNGMSLGQARRLCSTVETVPYEFDRYKELSLKFYSILFPLADDLQAVSIDEALIDVTSGVQSLKTQWSENNPDATELESGTQDFATEFAEALRVQVKDVTGCEISIGIGHNLMLARLATRRAKPAGTFNLTRSRLQEFLATIEVDQLHGIGRSVRSKVEEKWGTTLLAELGKKSQAELSQVLGKKTGETIWNAARGVDHTKLESDKPRKSVSCDINFGIRFETEEQSKKFIVQMATEVSTRLRDISMKGRSLTLKLMKRHPDAPQEPPKFLGHGHCESYSKSTPIAGPGGAATSDPQLISEGAWRLLSSFGFDPKELRGISIQILKLEQGPKSPKRLASERTVTSASVSEHVAAQQLPALPPVSAAPIINILPPSSSPDGESVGVQGEKAGESFPQLPAIDLSFLDALPPDIRREVEQEYKLHLGGLKPPTSSGMSMKPTDEKTESTLDKKAVRRITHQLAPRNIPSPALKKTFFNKRTPSTDKLNVPLANLRKLGIDPEVFDQLPIADQREQLAIHRALQKKSPKEDNLFRARAKVEPVGRVVPGEKFIPRKIATPKANILEDPVLIRKGRKGGPATQFVCTDDLQNLISQWVDSFEDEPPREKDVNYFTKFLVTCVDSFSPTETPLMRAVSVLKWWRIVLRTRWPEPSWSSTTVLPTGPPSVNENDISERWWMAFWEVKARMDAALAPKFGGSISLK